MGEKKITYDLKFICTLLKFGGSLYPGENDIYVLHTNKNSIFQESALRKIGKYIFFQK